MDIVRKYEGSKDKASSIKSLAIQYHVSEKEIVDLLNNYNIETPRIMNRPDAIDLEKQVKKLSEKVEFEKDLHDAVSINRFFSEMGWDNENDVDKAKQMCSYVRTKFGVKPFDVFVRVLESIIENKGIETIEQNINGKLNIGVENRIMDTILNLTENIVNEINEEYDPDKSLISKGFNAYKKLKKMKEDERNQLLVQGFEIIDKSVKRYEE